MLTTIILSRNEAVNIVSCLKSVTFSDQVILLDDYSTDNTVALARHTLPRIKIIKHHLGGDFSIHRNYALSRAHDDWVLFIDADETISQHLQKEILSAIKTSSTNGYYLKRLDTFLGRQLLHGETGNIQLLRLARKTSGQWIRPVHEIWQITGPISALNSPLYHHPHPTIFSFLDSINRYTTIDSNYRYLQGERFHLWQLLIFPTGKFLYNYYFRLGLLDGFPGLILAFIMSLHSLLVRIKLYELSRNPS